MPLQILRSITSRVGRDFAQDSSGEPEERTMKSVQDSGLKKTRKGETSAVCSRRLCAFTPPSLLVCSSRPQQRGDAPHASQVTSSPRRAANSCSQRLAPHRRDGRAFSFSSSPSLRVEEIGWILRSNHGQHRPISRVKSIIKHNASR